MFDTHTGVLDWGDTNEADLQSILDEEDNVKTRIIFAREELKVRSLVMSCCHKHITLVSLGGIANGQSNTFKACFSFVSILSANICLCRKPSVPFLALCLSLYRQTLQLSAEQIKYLCEEASRAQTQGQRAEIFACEVARASAGEYRRTFHSKFGVATLLKTGRPSFEAIRFLEGDRCIRCRPGLAIRVDQHIPSGNSSACKPSGPTLSGKC